MGQAKKCLSDCPHLLRRKVLPVTLSYDILMQLVFSDAVNVPGGSPIRVHPRRREHENRLIIRIAILRQHADSITNAEHSAYKLADERFVGRLAVQEQFAFAVGRDGTPPRFGIHGEDSRRANHDVVHVAERSGEVVDDIEIIGQGGKAPADDGLAGSALTEGPGPFLDFLHSSVPPLPQGEQCGEHANHDRCLRPAWQWIPAQEGREEVTLHDSEQPNQEKDQERVSAPLFVSSVGDVTPGFAKNMSHV